MGGDRGRIRTGRPGGAEYPDEPDLDFPDVPRQQLDQLLEQLTLRAQDVMAAQGRLRALLRANAAVVGELNLPAVLRRVLDAGCELLAARRGALGMVGSDGEEHYVHVGVDAAAVAELTSGPAGVVVGVPIRIRGRLAGHLYFADREGGTGFTDEDEQLVASLAATAAIAIENARLYEQSERRQRWMSTSAEVTRMLLAADAEPPMELIARRAAENADAVVAMLVRPIGQRRLAVEVAAGPFAEHLSGKVIPEADSLSGRAIRTGKPILSSRPGRLLRELDENVVRIGPVIAVPLTASSGTLGALCLARRVDVAAFTESDLDLVAGFANQAALALELARGRAGQEALRTMADHDRIAGDLHDHVIQQLFAVGMSLHATAAALTDTHQAARLTTQVAVLDATIAQIRATIYRLNAPQAARQPLRNRLVEVVVAAVDALGFDPVLRLVGPIDDTEPTLADDAVAVTREALSNCARHAAASAVHVSISAGAGRLAIEVTDNGRGVGTASRSSGLANLRRRAERRGGAFGLETADSPGGTRLTWTAPLTADPGA